MLRRLKRSKAVKVNIEDVQKAREFFKIVCSVPLTELQIYDNGKLLAIPKKIMEDFELCGLNNVDFILMRSWEQADG